MPLTPEQRQRLQARIGQPAVRPSQTSGGLPPEVAAIASQLPQGKPYVKSLGPSGPTIGYPVPQEEMTRQLGMEAAKLRLRSMTPQVGEAIKRDFSRIDAFEGILNDLEGLSKNFRKGPLRGTYAKLGAKATGGGEFAGVEAEESEDILNYSDLRPGVAAGLYRAITGDDRISDIDAAKRAMPFIPDPYLQPRAFQKRLNIVKRAIQRKRQSIRQSIRLGSSPQTSQEGEDSGNLFQGFMSSILTEEMDND